MPSEEMHEIGRRGLIEARLTLHRVLGGAIDLPFNAYDHPGKLKFDDPSRRGGMFSFDLGGTLRRTDGSTVTGFRTVEVFVEVKNYAEGSSLRTEYAEFFRRAAVVGSQSRHEDSWFVFLSSVPFGTKSGVQLCDGTFLSDCCSSWEAPVVAPADLQSRTALVFANLSMRRALEAWGAVL